MNDLRAAAQQALEALEWMGDCYVGDDDDAGECASCHERSYEPHAPDCKKNNAITNLRAALAQQDEPLNLRDPAVQKRLATQWGYVPAAQAEPVEPVAWMFELARNFNLVGYGGWEKRITEYRPNTPEGSVRNVTPLYTAPPQRKPLTEGEIKTAFHAARNAKLGASQDNSRHRLSVIEIARAVEKASWEKNHGQA